MLNAGFETAFEAAVADEWERHTKPKSEVFQEWDCAIETLGKAKELVDEAVQLLIDSARMVEASGDDDRIMSIADEISFLGNDIEKLAERMKEE